MDDFEKGEKVFLNEKVYLVMSIGQYEITLENKEEILIIPYDHSFYNAIQKIES
jgi:hypothetical protein